MNWHNVEIRVKKGLGCPTGEPMEANFDADGILFAKYPFPPASIYPHGHVAVSAIRDVDPTAAPPEVRTGNGETLFISARQSDGFRDWAENARLPIIRRVDVWDLILEPFLDTEFTPEQQERTLAALGNMGVPRTDVMRIRRSVGRAMLAYNFFLWDWVHLGLFDVLTATRQGLSWLSFIHRLSPQRYSDFYWSAMELADCGRKVVPEMTTGQRRGPEPPIGSD